MVITEDGVIHGFVVGVIGDHMDIIPLILAIGNNVKMVHGVLLILVVLA
jgi:hypothetical protein